MKIQYVETGGTFLLVEIIHNIQVAEIAGVAPLRQIKTLVI